MYKWGRNSLRIRSELDSRLQVVLDELLTYVDVSLICGHRGEQVQNDYFERGVSKVRFPNSKHNVWPSLAVDLQPHPYPDNEEDLRAALGYIAGLAMVIAANHGWQLRWGGDWNRNGSVVDNGFDDLFHLELYIEEADSNLDTGGDGDSRVRHPVRIYP